MRKTFLITAITCFTIVLLFSFAVTAQDKIDLNKATVSQIAKIPGIGEQTAEKIVAYRNKVGNFSNISELLKVEGIGEKTVQKIADYVLIDGKPAVYAPASTSKPSSKPSGKININKASQKELETLPGVGKVTAERIIEYREKNGPFKKASDLKKVKGIGDKTYQKMADQVVVE